MLSAKTVTRQTGTAPADDTQTSDELEEDLEQSGEESSDVSSEEDGKVNFELPPLLGSMLRS